MVPSAWKLGEPIRAAIPLHPPYHPSEPRAPCPIGKEYLWSSHYLSTLTSGEHTAPSVEPDDDQETCLALTESSRTRKLSKGERDENRPVIPSEYSPFLQKARKRLTKQEQHAVSEKLSQQLSELNWMLKNALGNRAMGETNSKDGDAGDEEVHSGNEETLLPHSDNVMEYRPKKPRPGFSMYRKTPYRSHSLSPSSVNKHRQLQKERKRQHKSKGTDSRHFQAKMAQVEQLKREAQRENRSKKKLEDKIEEALRRHDLLTVLVKKECDHDKRLPSPKLPVDLH